MGPDPTLSRCDRWQEAISALLDGEDAGVVPTLVEAHLRRCHRCRAYEAQVSRLRSLSRLGPGPGVRPADEVGEIVGRLRAAERAGMRLVLRGCLVVVAVQVGSPRLGPDGSAHGPWRWSQPAGDGAGARGGRRPDRRRGTDLG